ncbi:hypothetical protein [Flectobacillus roseus]|uniref:hypothetical protein n=1 Tax=Flectobacillus roseus TaxID=502259 RepID=UPI0024B87371|nr:hypothetical protein [Flectobacillus roseus]MDI9871295.1 hypothetical protein [Flectobacillus roseus]
MKLYLSIIFCILSTYCFAQVKKASTPKGKQTTQEKIDYCKEIIKGSPSEDGRTLYMSPEVEGVRLATSVSKDTTYLVSLKVTSDGNFDSAKGVNIYLEGKTIDLEEEEISIEANSGEGPKYLYKSTASLSAYQFITLSIFELKVIKLYVVDKKISKEGSFKIMRYAECLTGGN